MSVVADRIDPTLPPSQRVALAYKRIYEEDRPEVWIDLRPEGEVLSDAHAVEQRLADGADLPLAGLLVAVKGNIDVGGLPTTAACPELGVVAEKSATAVRRLVDAGALVLGTTNLDQFATGLVGTRSPYGAVRCAWDPERVSGGSSAGSAVAVALGVVDVALGTDTAGSGRVPAALHDLVGIKATLGLVPTAGVVPACVDYDAVTVFAADLATAAAAMRTMIGPDEEDPRSRSWPATVRLAAAPRPRVAVPRADDLTALSPEFAAAFGATVDGLTDRGIDTVTVDVSALLDAATLLYDGAVVAQRYAAVGAFLETAPANADPTVAAIVRGAKAPAAHEYVTDLDRLTRVRALAVRMLADVDALLLPTTTEHPTIAAVQAEPVAINRRMGTFTNFCNLLDLAAVAVPGAATAAGDPFGVMLVTDRFDDQVAVDVAARLVGEPSPDLGAGGVDVLVVGAHLAGFPAHGQLVERGARFLGEVRTSTAYRLQDLHTEPPKPGLVRVGDGGAEIAGELYRLAPAHLGTFLAALPAPMGLGPVELSDGRWVTGFTCSQEAADAGTDITEYGGWRAYRAR